MNVCLSVICRWGHTWRRQWSPSIYSHQQKTMFHQAKIHGDSGESWSESFWLLNSDVDSATKILLQKQRDFD